jgi:hypothetical protein
MATYTHENLKFILPPQQRSCFYEDISLDNPTRTVEIFIHSAGDMEVLLAIYGPMDYQTLVHVRIILQF